MVSNQGQSEEKQRQVTFEGWLRSGEQSFNFDMWAVEVRRQMIASLKKREGSRANWD
ncbi:MAG: hypothetical protein HC827_13850 [Cyanobacteria bacterium RM1_2_2]|nr:hypothetical protein [Cyanobacteria bacterium RM1_2_2]